MKRSLRSQLLFSHLLPVGLMLLALIGAIAGFFQLGHSVDRILKNNYRSVVAAQNMKESLERMDNAATFFLTGQAQKARRQYAANAARFEAAYGIEANNITEVGEAEIAADLGVRFAAYRRDLARLLDAHPALPPTQARAFYFETLEPEFVALKQRAQDVLNLNQAAIVRENARAKKEAQRDALMGIAATAATALLAMGLAWRQIGVIMTPLLTVTRQAEEIGAGRLDQSLNQSLAIRRADEIGALALAFDRMAEKLRDARRALFERLQRAERMSDAALENLYDPVLVTDAQGHVVHLNRAAEGLWGPEARAAGRDVAEVVREPRITHAVERAIRQERVSAEEGDAALVSFPAQGAPDTPERGAPAQGADGVMRAYRLRVTPMFAAEDSAANEYQPCGLIGAVTVLEDVTYLREIDRLKTEFIGVASHELRTPVTSLLMSVDLLREGALGVLTPEQREVVEAQKEDLERLERMMRDLLDLTRLEAGVQPPRWEIVSPSDLLQTVRQGLQMQAEAKGVVLRVDAASDLPTVRADRAQIGRVLTNLVGNAVRHTPFGGMVTLGAARGTMPASANVVALPAVAFVVKDSGTGIPPEYLPRIFDRFVQVPGATRGGAGLGLSIAQNIVRAHGGEIEAQSTPGRGSGFTFSLPIASAKISEKD